VTDASSGAHFPRPARSDAERAEEHGAIARLADGLLPELVAKLAATGLAELEVREGPWKVRLRRPMEVVGSGRRASDRQLRLTGATGPVPHPAPGGAGAVHSPSAGARAQDGRVAPEPERPAASSPAVGIFRPRAGIAGTRVRAGDRLGAVEMLGVPQEVLAPIDGIVGGLLAEPGEGVEYGQALIEMRPAAAPGGAAPAAPVAERATPAAAAAGERA
jgi:biotin carboxyl carrier protein